MTEAAQFEELFKRHYAAVLRYGLRRTDPESARDMAAQTFLVAWREFGRLPARPLPWLYGVARRELINAHRIQVRQDKLTERLRAVAVPAPPDDDVVFVGLGDTADGADSTFIRHALARLSAGDQEVLRLAAWEELGPSGIASVMGCRVGTAAVRLHRARRRLAAAITARPAVEPHDSRHSVAPLAREQGGVR